MAEVVQDQVVLIVRQTQAVLVVIKYPVAKKANPTYWGALGDSITAGAGVGGNSYSYANVAAKKIGANIHNHGISGSCINDGYNLALTRARI